MRLVIASGVALLICACFSDGPRAVSAQAPTLTRNVAEQLMLRADDVKRSVLESKPTPLLAETFRGRALELLQAQAQALDRRGFQEQERNVERTLVFWDPGAGEAVLQVIAQRRIVTPDQPNPAWASTVRQWWARVVNTDGMWWVVDQEDLTPDRWRPGAPSG
jgi:hypothetical protein